MDKVVKTKYVYEGKGQPLINEEFQMAADREMSLEEYLNQLPDSHRANKEYQELKQELAEVIEDAFMHRGYLQNDGWWDSQASTSAVTWGDWLVKNAGWEKREGGVGDRQWYRPKQKKITLEGPPRGCGEFGG